MKKIQLIALVSRSDHRVEASSLHAFSFATLRLDAARAKRYKSPITKRGSSVRNARREWKLKS